MTGAFCRIAGIECFATRSGYTGEDGYEISVPAEQARRSPSALLAQPRGGSRPAWARATRCAWKPGLCLYGHDIDDKTTPVARRPDLGDPEGAPRGGARVTAAIRRRAIDNQPRRRPAASASASSAWNACRCAKARKSSTPRATARPRHQRHAGADRGQADRDGLPGEPTTPCRNHEVLRRRARQEASRCACTPCPSRRTATTAAEPRWLRRGLMTPNANPRRTP